MTEERDEDLEQMLLRHGHAEWDEFDASVMAQTILTSPWLAERLAKARADALEEAAQAVSCIPTADPFAYEGSNPAVAYRSGWEAAHLSALDAIQAHSEKT